MFGPATKILVVDDFSTMRKIVKKGLTDLGLKGVKEAEDGLEAWKLLTDALDKGQPFELVFSDIKMPNLSGLELLQKMRSHPQMQAVPFIVVTTESDQENILKAIQLGAADYLVKPFTLEKLKSKIQAAWKKSPSSKPIAA